MESELQMLSRHDAHLPPLYNVLLLGDEARQGDSSQWFPYRVIQKDLSKSQGCIWKHFMGYVQGCARDWLKLMCLFTLFL